MKKHLSLLILASTLLIACKKETTVDENKPTADLSKNVGNINEMIIPNGFVYHTARKMHLSIPMSDPAYGSAIQKIQVYDGNPLSNGNLLFSGLAKYPNLYEADFLIPDNLDVLYIKLIHPDQSSAMKKVDATGTQISVDMLNKMGKSLNKTIPSSPDCNTGCTQTATGNQNIFLNNSATVLCITGNFSGNLDINRGTVRICGNASIGSCNLNNDATLLIASGATVTFNNLNQNTSTTTFRNWSTNVTMRSSFSPNGILSNYGNLIVSGDMNVNGNAQVSNDGLINISGSLNNNKILVNNGKITVNGSFAQNSGGVLTNNCQLTIGGNANLNNPVTNNEYILVSQNTTINSGCILTMVDGAMLKTNNLTANNTIQGTGSVSFIKVAANTTINGGGKLLGSLQYCDANGIETNWGSISGTVSLGCSQYIPVSYCNPDGNGTITIPDADGDGASDSLDEYPNDPDQAFNNYYPNEKEMATVAYEDLWPNRGDYDMNDLVVNIRHNMITNANDEIIKFEAVYVLRANGGSQKLAFCMGLPLKAGNIDKLEGATVEEGHDNIVLQVFDDSKKELAGWNTVPTQPVADYKEFKVSFTLKTPVSVKEFGAISYFDPFIWVNESGKGRGYEIHVAGNTPTKLADTKWFGYADDDTNLEKGKYYLTDANLPWAFVVPESFDYCSELSQLGLKVTPDITQAYLHFAQWAQSGGEIYKDWYKDYEGYRNKEYIYGK